MIWKGSQATSVIKVTFSRKFVSKYCKSKYSRNKIIDMKYTTALATCINIIRNVSLWIYVYTFSISIMISAVKVIITMFANESWNMKRPIMRMVVPWKIDFHSHIKNVLMFIDLPF